MLQLNSKYQIFLSYRREDGQLLARMLKESLARKGYRVFLDMDELQDGVFDERILDALDEAPIYMLLMTEQCFSRCGEENDWVRREIERAIDKGKVIVPVNPDRQFKQFPADIPEHIRNGLKVYQHSALDTGLLYQESVDKLVRERVKPVIGVKHKALIWAIGLFFVTLVPYMLAYYCFLPSYYVRKGDKLMAKDSATMVDTLDAMKYYRHAINARNVEAYGRMGDMYGNTSMLFNTNWVSDEDSAMYYYKKGAYAGDAYSQYKLADKMSQLFTVDYDKDSAFHWANQAYENGYYKAAGQLADFYREGKCVPEDVKRAERLYKEGIEMDDVAAHYNLGTLYLEEFGESHRTEAYEHLIAAYAKGEEWSEMYVGGPSSWVLHPAVDSLSEPLVRIKLVGWDMHDTMRLYCEWHNKKFMWMQIDRRAYIENVYTGERYTVCDVRNCKFSPDTTNVPLGYKHDFQLLFVGVPDTLTRINFCESDSSQWKFYGVDLSEKIEMKRSLWRELGLTDERIY